MRVLVLILCCVMPLFGAATSVGLVEFSQKQGSVEVVLQVGEAYKETPRLTQQDGYKGVIFPHLQARSQNENVKASFMSEVQIFNIDDDLYVIGVGDARLIDIDVGQSSRAFKVSFQAVSAQKELDTLLQTSHEMPQLDTQIQAMQQKNEAKEAQNLIPFKTDLGIDTWRYVAVLLVMVFLVLVLLYVKRYVVGGKGAKKGFGGYFSSFSSSSDVFDPTKIEVVSQKTLDSKHRILTIESNGYRYLILIGATSTTLIDRYPIPQGITPREQLHFDDQFAKLLEQKQERLSKYIHES